MALEPIQYILVGALVVIGGGGYWNMQRMKKKKIEEEMFGDELEQEAATEVNSVPPETEEQIKNSYIEKISEYKTPETRNYIQVIFS